MAKRRPTRVIDLGGAKIGGEHPIRVQSMTNTDTRNVDATLAQVQRLTEAGCEFVRLAVPDDKAARILPQIRAGAAVPLIADIHFDHRLAVQALEAGVQGLRINPGNIGAKSHVDRVVDAAKVHGACIRIGVNGGSLEKELLQQFGGATPEAMVASALGHAQMLLGREFDNFKISLKSSSVPRTIAAYRLLAEKLDCPLHIGITEAGTLLRGAVKSGVGLGILLWEGLGDTLRVSLTADPVLEVRAAWEILRSLGMRQRGPEIISCPTCGRTEINLQDLAEEVERRLSGVSEVFTVAVMGCVVNGPGEAREADIGLAGGRDCGIIFRRGEVLRKVRGQDRLLAEFMRELDVFLFEKQATKD
ncbi:MAG TPA: flavodoxin-dependent (E)-4-hydroxy-3-methylbut-2-enyl-diphosphate synthase [Desulfonatronum sp.]|nr:flavodoxin-dependent (E)-4-hydroxy-3-methylbut-2-enyl-diphosphate synthase [Desulfonatronum sp.]